MAQDPELIRRDIEETRQHMGDTVDALAYKADVPSRTKDKFTGAVDSVKERVGGATPNRGEVTDGAKRAVGAAQNNPLGLAIGFAAAGFIAGLLAPGTRVENEKIGPMADQVKDQVKETGQEALERGQQVAQEAAQSAQQTVQEKGREHGEELASSAQQNMQEATSR